MVSWEKMRQEAAVRHWNSRPYFLGGSTEENHKTFLSISGPSFERRSSEHDADILTTTVTYGR